MVEKLGTSILACTTLRALLSGLSRCIVFYTLRRGRPNITFSKVDVDRRFPTYKCDESEEVFHVSLFPLDNTFVHISMIVNVM